LWDSAQCVSYSCVGCSVISRPSDFLVASLLNKQWCQDEQKEATDSEIALYHCKYFIARDFVELTNGLLISQLSSSHFFRAFPYNGMNGSVREDEYEGAEEWWATFERLQSFSVQYGTTLIPDDYECNPSFRQWIADIQSSLLHFIKGDPCELSIRQIELLVLIGFAADREKLPNLTRSDILWLRKLAELKR
jgi:hypothetical protein